MSTIHILRSRSRIEIERREVYDTFSGTREDLIAAGIASEAMFPEWPKRVLWDYQVQGDGQPPGWKVQRIKGGRFVVTRWHELRRTPAPWDPDDFRVSVGNAAIWATDRLLEFCQGDETHCYSELDWEWITYHKTELLREIWHAEIVPKRRRAFRVIEGGARNIEK
jgi:hypothetical protein